MPTTSLRKKTGLGRPFFTPSPEPNERLADYTPNRRQHRWLGKLNLHGSLSSNYLFEYDRLEGLKNYGLAKKKLNELWRAGYVKRPEQQLTNYTLRNSHYVYALTKKGRTFLAATGHSVESLPPSGPWVHQFMISTITATMEILCRREGYRFVPAHEILKGRQLACDVPFTWKKRSYTKALIPDSIFAIDYGKSFIFYVVEADRNTEGNDLETPHRKCVRRSVRQYARFNEMYRDHYGLKAPMVVLNITTSEPHIDNCLQIVDEEIGPCNFLAYGLAPSFGYYWRPPQLMSHLFTEGLKRNGRQDWIIKKDPN